MKQFLITLLAVGVLASAAQAEARLVSKRGECVAACGQAISDGCGWITKRGKFNRCRAKLINQCKHFGTAQVCPPPPPPSSPTGPTATTTLPPPTTTTTTVPYIPPTTTTLPPPPPLTDLRGSYEFEGYVTDDACGLVGIGSYAPVPFTVTGQSGTDLVGTHGADGTPAVGTYTPATGGWNMGEYYYKDGCTYTTGVGVGNDYGFTYGVPATWFFEANCTTIYCYVEATGLVFYY
jgi:hypothetical protein